jgi:hypothetical protein
MKLELVTLVTITGHKRESLFWLGCRYDSFRLSRLSYRFAMQPVMADFLMSLTTLPTGKERR